MQTFDFLNGLSDEALASIHNGSNQPKVCFLKNLIGDENVDNLLGYKVPTFIRIINKIKDGIEQKSKQKSPEKDSELLEGKNFIRLNSFLRDFGEGSLGDIMTGIENYEQTRQYLSLLPPETLQLAVDFYDKDKKNNPRVQEAIKEIKAQICARYIVDICNDKSNLNRKHVVNMIQKFLVSDIASQMEASIHGLNRFTTGVEITSKSDETMRLFGKSLLKMSQIFKHFKHQKHSQILSLTIKNSKRLKLMSF